MMTFLKYVFYLVILLVIFYVGYVFYNSYFGTEPVSGETIVVTEG